MPTNRRSEAIWIEAKGYWQIKVQKDGERKAFTSSIKGRKGKHEAEAKADYWLEQGTADMRFDKAWDTFLEHTKRNTSSGNYINIEKCGRLYLLPSLKNKKLHTITRNDWQSCITEMTVVGDSDGDRKKPLSERTCKNAISNISSFLSFCESENWRISPIKKALTIPAAATPTKEKQVLQPDDLKTLFSDPVMPYRGKLEPAFYIHAWRFYVVTGLRRGELAGLKNEDINKTLTIKRSINNLGEETKGKNENARRTMMLTGIALDILSDQRAMLDRMDIKSDWAFPDKFGERSDPNLIYKHWVKYRDHHGIKCTIHELRHTFVSINKVDMPIELLKSIVGHSVSMDTIGIYGHEIDGEKELAAQYVDSAFAKLLQ